MVDFRIVFRGSHVISKSGQYLLFELSACIDTNLHTQPGSLSVCAECECVRCVLIGSLSV